MSKHGVFIQEEGTAITVPIIGTQAICVIGTAPVNMAPDPAATVNVPILANTAVEAMQQLGYSTDFEHFTLCQEMYITNNVYQVGPVVYINVLDPAKHKKPIVEVTVPLHEMQGRVGTEGILISDLVVKKVGEDQLPLELGKDYTAEFDTDGSLILTMIEGGKAAQETSVKVSGNKIDPTQVKKEDILGAYNPTTGAETGAEVIRQVYPKLGVIPAIIIAPGYSHIPEIGIALAAKAANINGVFKGMALLDLDTTKAKKYTDTKTQKETNGYTSEFCYPLWPYLRIGEYIFPMSALVAALVAYTDAGNDDVPSLSPSNKMLGVTGTCLADGTEVVVDQDQGSTVNTYGVTTAINVNGWRLWGNYTGAYPSSGDAKDIWFPVRRMFNWQGNNFILTYFTKVDDPMNPKLIESVVDSENIRCAAYAPDKWAGANIQYLAADNPITDILAGKITFRQSIAPYTPAQEITNILSYDTALLQSVLQGGE